MQLKPVRSTVGRCACAALVSLCAMPAFGAVGVNDPCPWPTPFPPAGAGWATANNPGFELPYSGGVADQWIGWQDATYTGQVHFEGSDRSFDGTRSQKLSLPQPPPDTAHQEAGVYQQIYVIPGETYTVTARVYLEFAAQTYNGEDLLAFLGVDPFGGDAGDGGSFVWDERSSADQWLTMSVTATAYLPVMTITLKGTRKWPQHGDGALVWFDAVTVSGPVPTEPPPTEEPDPVDPETLIPETVGGNLVSNPSFESAFSNGVSSGWNKWWTTGSGRWKRSERMGKVGPGFYDCGDVNELSLMNPKTVLLFSGDPFQDPNNTGSLGHSNTLANESKFSDTIFVGRPFVDTSLDQIFDAPAYWGREYGDLCKHLESLMPRIDCWQGLNEPGTDDPDVWQKTLEFEHAFAVRAHELGVKTCSMNLATGNPGNIWRMIQEEFDPSAHDVLDLADYLGHHVYGGPTDQFMVNNQTTDDPCSFALRPRRFKDMYDRRDWRFPPVIATEGSTWGPWKGDFSADQVVDDCILMGQYMQADRWWTGYTNFANGIQCNGAWIGWDMTNIRIADNRLMSEAIGDWNEDNPADAMDGLYAQMFGAGHPHPKNTSELVPDGDFNGGINRQVGGLTPGKVYLLICWMKYEFRGMQPDQLEFYLGVDQTGQTSNGGAGTIDWGDDQIAGKAPVHEIYTHVYRTFTASSSTVSVWLRAHHPVSDPSIMCYVDQVEVKELAAPPGPSIQVAPTQIDVSTTPGVSPPDGSFTVANGGPGTINYTLADDCDWLSLSPANGASTGEVDTITIEYDTDQLLGGLHECQITVTAPEADNSPLGAPHVTLTVETVGADFDGDGDADQDDYGHFQECLTGVGVPITDPGCDNADFDADEDVDSDDFDVFTNCAAGAGVPPNPGCEG